MLKMKDGINVLSCFDGISVGLEALKKAGKKVNRYIASEIDESAILVSKKNNPKIEHIGDIKNVSYNEKILHFGENSCISPISFDLIIAGSPCQGFSRAGKGLNFEDDRSKLFFEFVRLLKEVREENPDVQFLLENVNMKKEWENIITQILGVKPERINSSLFLPHNRPRTYWTNIPFDRNIEQREYKISAILDQEVNESYYINNELYNKIVLEKKEDRLIIKNATKKGFLEAFPGDCVSVAFPTSKTRRGRVKKGVVGCQTTSRSECIVENNLRLRYMTRNEVERSQGLKTGFTKIASENQAQKMCGNSWTVDVIEYLFKNIGQKV